MQWNISSDMLNYRIVIGQLRNTLVSIPFWELEDVNYSVWKAYTLARSIGGY